MAPMTMNCTPVIRPSYARLRNGSVANFSLPNAAVLWLALVLTACSTSPDRGAEVKPIASTVEPIGEYLSRGQSMETAEAGRESARQVYRAAAKAYPADKRPWLRLAQSYFDNRDYGNAVLAAEEVVHRDSTDVTAQSLLAVSGLRISTAALSALRSPSDLNSSTRQEAEGMAQNLRMILGEPVLIPRPVEAELPVRPKAGVKQRPVARTAPASGVISPPANAKPAGAASPFGSLN